MIRSLTISDFKSWAGETEVPLRSITGLFGTNSSGKSSILQALLVLKQTAESLDRSRVLHLGDDRSLLDLGTFYDVVNRHDTTHPLHFSVQWSLREPLAIENPERKSAVSLQGDEIRFSVDVREEGQGDGSRLVVDQFHYDFGKASFGMVRRTDGKYDVVADGWELRRRKGRPWPLPDPIKNYGFPDQAANYFQNADFLDDLSLAFEHLLAEVSYVGPLRDYPRRSYTWGGERPSSVGESGDDAINALLAARAEGRKLGRGKGRARRYVTFEARVAQWLKEMGLIDSFAVRRIGRNRKEYEVRIRQAPAMPEVLITDVGFGVSQLLPVIIQCYYAPEDSLIIFAFALDELRSRHVCGSQIDGFRKGDRLRSGDRPTRVSGGVPAAAAGGN